MGVINMKEGPNFGNFFNSLGNLLLVLMFIVMIFVSSIALMSAFGNYRLSAEMIKVIDLELKRTICNDSLINEKNEINPIIKTFIDQLECEQRGTLDASTISFLFQIFSFSLVTVGAYLLARSHANVKSADEKIKSAENFIKRNALSTAIEGYVSLAHHSSWSLSTKASESNISAVRESIRNLKANLKLAEKDKIGTNHSHLESIADRVGQIVSILKSLSLEFQSGIGDYAEIVNNAEECYEELRDILFANKKRKSNHLVQEEI
jgi:hypothetical protein